jgi:hypothetical protein
VTHVFFNEADQLVFGDPVAMSDVMAVADGHVYVAPHRAQKKVFASVTSLDDGLKVLGQNRCCPSDPAWIARQDVVRAE